MSNNYSWAVNPAKLKTAIEHVTTQSKIDPSIKIDEETVKAEYVKLKGLVRETDSYDEVDEEEADESPKAKRKSKTK